jgi:hypothetical protein
MGLLGWIGLGGGDGSAAQQSDRMKSNPDAMSASVCLPLSSSWADICSRGGRALCEVVSSE